MPSAAALARLEPRYGWATLAVLCGLVLTVGVTIQRAEWTDTPGMVWVVLGATAAGLALGRARWPWPAAVAAGLLLGALVVFWQATRLAETASALGAWPETASRLAEWYRAATSGGISTDLLPFSVALLAGGWLLGFLGSWFVFRCGQVWPALILGGLALFTHISFLPSELVASFFVFVALGMLLMVRMGAARREIEWREAGARYSAASGWATAAAALAVAAALLAVAAALPLNAYVSRTVATVWTQARTPVAALEEGLGRLVTGVASKKNIHGRPFGDNLPFLGSIHFNGEVVFTADTDYPSYWLQRTYSEYTPRGWVAGATRPIEVGPDSVAPAQADLRSREAVAQSLSLRFDTAGMLAGGGVEWLSRGARLEALEPRSFDVSLADPSRDAALPADVRELAARLRPALADPAAGYAESEVARMLPDDLVVTHVLYSEDGPRPVISGLRLQRKESIAPDIVSYEFDREVPAGESYEMVSLVSTASRDDLRRAGTEYDAAITDHYLQLPADLPDRVAELARRVTATARTPVDRARAIEEYLRGPSFTYSQDIDAPPADTDGVDHFLFETRTGYSDYFASAMAVMLRSVGVPARLAAGYAPGEYDPATGLNAVRDSDSHAWVQAYFPGFGWIDFEPTPAWPDPARGIGRPAAAGAPADVGSPGGQEESDFGGFAFPAQLSAIGLGTEGGFEGGGGGVDILRFVVAPIAGVLGAALIAAAALRALWALALRGLSARERAYAKMAGLGRVAGLGRAASQTPAEYGAALGLAMPAVAADCGLIAERYCAARYGGGDAPEHDEGLEGAWRRIRRALVARAIGRLVPGAGREGE